MRKNRRVCTIIELFKTVTANPIREKEKGKQAKTVNYVSGRTIEVCVQGTVLVSSFSLVQRTGAYVAPIVTQKSELGESGKFE